MGPSLNPSMSVNTVPTVGDLCDMLGFQRASVQDTNRFLEATRGWRKSYLMTLGKPIAEQLHWNNLSDKELLENMAKSFIDNEGNGDRFWSPKRVWNYNSTLHFPRDREKIIDLLKQLFWKQSWYAYNNSKTVNKAEEFQYHLNEGQTTTRASEDIVTPDQNIPVGRLTDSELIQKNSTTSTHAAVLEKSNSNTMPNKSACQISPSNFLNISELSSDSDTEQNMTSASSNKRTQPTLSQQESSKRMRMKTNSPRSLRRTYRNHKLRNIPGRIPESDFDMYLDLHDSIESNEVGNNVHRDSPLFTESGILDLPSESTTTPISENRAAIASTVASDTPGVMPSLRTVVDAARSGRAITSPKLGTVSMFSDHANSDSVRDTNLPKSIVLSLENNTTRKEEELSANPPSQSCHSTGKMHSSPRQLEVNSTTDGLEDVDEVGSLHFLSQTEEASIPPTSEPAIPWATTEVYAISLTRESATAPPSLQPSYVSIYRNSTSESPPRYGQGMGTPLPGHPQTSSNDAKTVTPSRSSSLQVADQAAQPPPSARQRTEIWLWIVTRSPIYTDERWDSGKLKGVSLPKFLESISAFTHKSHIQSINMTLSTPTSKTKIIILKDQEDSWNAAKKGINQRIKNATREGREKGQMHMSFDIMIEPVYEQDEDISGAVDDDEEDFV